jgi:hypothetical protein
MESYHVRFRSGDWGIGTNGNWHAASHDLEVAKHLAISIATHAAELGLSTSVVVHHKDGTEEVVWEGAH